MTRPSPLDAALARAGIEAGYTNAWGEKRQISLATRKALLAAMGFRGSVKAIAARMKDYEEASWRRPLRPVMVVPARISPLRIPIVVPAHRAREVTVWSLEEERGAVHNGAFRAAELPVSARETLDGVAVARRHFTLPLELPAGYHRFRLGDGGAGPADAASMLIIVAPGRCYLPSGFDEGGKFWGLAVQLYALRCRRNWGMGDFGDLRRLAGLAARLGAAAVGLNPLHTSLPGSPDDPSPYSPSSRIFLNALYLDVEAIPDFRECAAAQSRVKSAAFSGRLHKLRRACLVDYAGVAEAKLPVLRLLYRSFRRRHLGGAAKARLTARGRAFRRYQQREGRALELTATFEALSDHFAKRRRVRPAWRDWPAAYRDPDSAAVAGFAARHRDQIEFYHYLQWQAERQLETAARRCRRDGMAIGLYRDLAIGANGDGAEAWMNQKVLARGISVGAPPDPFNQRGQNWGFPPYVAMSLEEAAYEPFIALLRANMRHAGALRIDHILGFMRLFWIPRGKSPDAGGYVRYPFDDLLGILALESHRNRCLIVGEDLGTLPTGLRGRLRRAGILSYRLLYFERSKKGGFLPPERYPALSTVAVTTHDLPTFPGFWLGHDIALRARLGLFASAKAEAEALRSRCRDRGLLLAALKRRGLIQADAAAAKPSPEPAPCLVRAVYRYLAHSPGLLLMVCPEDVLGQIEQVNLPGTVGEHPNWRRKLSPAMETLGREARLMRLAAALSELRPPPPPSRRRRG